MSTPSPAPAPPPARRRVRKRVLIPLIVLAVLVALFAWLYVRGTWADTVEHNPKTAAQGAVTQLFRTPEGDVQVRCAIIIETPAAKVWTVIRDYANHPRFLPYVSAMEVQPKEGDRVHLTGTAHSRLWGDWSFAMDVNHKEIADKEYIASWDESSDTIEVNRGSWTLTAAGPGQTLAVYVLQIQATGYPNFFVRNLLLDRVPKVVTAMRDEVMRRKAGKEQAARGARRESRT